MTILALLLATCLVAFAGPEQDLAQAIDPDLPVVARQEAFDRLVQLGATDISLVRSVASDPAADSRKRWVCARALGKIGGGPAEEILLTLL